MQSLQQPLGASASTCYCRRRERFSWLVLSTHSRRHFEVSDVRSAARFHVSVRRAVFDFGDKEATVSDRPDDTYFDGNGVSTE